MIEEMSNEQRPITGSLPKMTFCYSNKPVQYTSYYLPDDLPRVHAPIDFRPTWKGAESTPCQRPESMIDLPSKDRPSFGVGGFLPHNAEYVHYASAIDNESALRNLDQPLSERAFGQRILFPQTSSNPVKDVGSYFDSENKEGSCGVLRKYDSSGHMNSARFNNSTRMTTKNMVLPYVEPASTWNPQETGRIGSVPVRRP